MADNTPQEATPSNKKSKADDEDEGDNIPPEYKGRNMVKWTGTKEEALRLLSINAIPQDIPFVYYQPQPTLEEVKAQFAISDDVDYLFGRFRIKIDFSTFPYLDATLYDQNYKFESMKRIAKRAESVEHRTFPDPKDIMTPAEFRKAVQEDVKAI